MSRHIGGCILSVTMILITAATLTGCAQERIQPTQAAPQPTQGETAPTQPEAAPTQGAASPTAGGAMGLDGATLLQERCSSCHGIGRVTSQRKTREEWERTVSGMIAMGARLTPEEKAILVEYLAATYGK